MEIICEAEWEAFGFQYPNPMNLNPTVSMTTNKSELSDAREDLINKHRAELEFIGHVSKTGHFHGAEELSL